VPHSPIVRQVSSRVASLAGNSSVRTVGRPKRLNRVWTALDVHAPPQVGRPLRRTARALSSVSSAEPSRCWGGQYESWFNIAERALAALGAAAAAKPLAHLRPEGPMCDAIGSFARLTVQV
jgi:hypothetical protein